MMRDLQQSYPARRDELIELLGIDVKWRMHQVSDGQRRRVQIFIGLLRPFKILLLDEVTVSLDVIVRMDLLRWLKAESEKTGCTILYATHIFDGLDDWPSHLHYLKHNGETGWQGKTEDLEIYREFKAQGATSPLLKVAEYWLRKELKDQKDAAAAGSTNASAEPADGEGAHKNKDPTQASYLSAGGFAPGRMAAYDYAGTS